MSSEYLDLNGIRGAMFLGVLFFYYCCGFLEGGGRMCLGRVVKALKVRMFWRNIDLWERGGGQEELEGSMAVVLLWTVFS